MPDVTSLAPRWAATQDGRDLLALLAGIKPVCLLGRGEAASALLLQIAADASLPIVEAAPLAPAPAGELPEWYLAACLRRREAAVIYVCRDAVMAQFAAVLAAQGRVSAADEAVLLGYPLCCVEQHHRQALALERFIAELTERRAQGDRARMARLIATGADPSPASAAEWARYDRLTAIAPAPFTSVNMCDGCAGDADSPARRLSRRYRALAWEH
ncbi:MAG TPA: hypothetical protein VN832_08410 [Stellaceae bacterium]|nr:hypothetical protein [Stellaceae bacterium]